VPPTLRHVLGAARPGTREFVRAALGRARRHPAGAPAVPRPAHPRNGRTLRLTHALIASDLNPHYLDFWPLARRAWSEIAGLEPLLVLVAEPAEVPPLLRDDPSVHVFPPVSGVHTAFQAQCIRLLYPALLDVDGAVVTSDADMVPLNRRYFHRPLARIDDGHFVAYRNVLLADEMIPICYNAALPRTWGAVFGVRTLDDARQRLGEWGAVEYSGERGGTGWATDQQILYRRLVEYGRQNESVWILDDRFTRFRRLERGSFWKPTPLDRRTRSRLRRGAYSDFHCATPYADFRELNELAVELAIKTRRRR
jgi:hypothetical protein